MVFFRRALYLDQAEGEFDNFPRTTTAACVLHNFCLMQGDSYNDDDDRGAPDDQDDDGGDAVRELLMDHLIGEGQL